MAAFNLKLIKSWALAFGKANVLFNIWEQASTLFLLELDFIVIGNVGGVGLVAFVERQYDMNLIVKALSLTMFGKQSLTDSSGPTDWVFC